MTSDTTKRLQQAINEVIQTQIRDGNPPETEQTLQRLVRDGFTKQQAMQLIGHVVVKEIFDVIRQGKEYNEQEYVNRLKELPKLPWVRGKNVH